MALPGGGPICVYTSSSSPSGPGLILAFNPTSAGTTPPTDAGDVVTAQTIGEHHATRVQAPSTASCTLYLDVKDQGVIVEAVHQDSSEQACTHATAVASQIEPELP